MYPRLQQELVKLITYIADESPMNASKVAESVEIFFEKVIKNPENFPPDKFKKNNEAALYRAFEIKSIRFAYKFEEGIIKVVRCSHVKRNPLMY